MSKAKDKWSLNRNARVKYLDDIWVVKCVHSEDFSDNFQVEIVKESELDVPMLRPTVVFINEVERI